MPDVNGLNRFKYGILVDDFSSYSTSDTANPDFYAKINLRKRELSPASPVTNFQLQNPQVLASYGTLTNTSTYAVASDGTGTSIFTLPYTVANVVVQPLASNTVSVNPLGVAVYQGVTKLAPAVDNWVDGYTAPSVSINHPAYQLYQVNGGLNATNMGDFASIPGTSIKSTTTKDVTAIGTQTDTATYATTSSISSYNPVSSIFDTTEGYLKNTSLLPYIRPQQIGFSVKGLLVNTPLNVYFDGQKVSANVTTPDTIEVSSVTGTFKENDIIGFFNNSQFTVTGRVVGTYVYPANTQNVRLYVSSVPGTPTYSDINTIQNALFDSTGAYIPNSGTASATVNFNTGGSISNSGTIRGVGGSIISGNNVVIYKVQYPQIWGAFLNQYGSWGSANQSGTYNLVSTFTPTANATYRVSVSSTGVLNVTANQTALFTNQGNNYTSIANNTTGLNIALANVGNPVIINIAVTGANTYQSGISIPKSEPGVAVVIYDTSNNIVFRSDVPPSTIYSNTASYINMANGGSFFFGANTVQLDSKASSNNSFYAGGRISISSKLVFNVVQQTATFIPSTTTKNRDGDSSVTVPAQITYDTKA